MTLAVFMLPLAERSKIPYTVILAVVGVALGFLAQQLGVGGATSRMRRRRAMAAARSGCRSPKRSAD
ncbi:MAG: hypothetical protein HC850_18280 [Rhodomicrobium sp.]|nr:hypothetical protein [Rhodomicrobium sp.]